MIIPVNGARIERLFDETEIFNLGCKMNDWIVTSEDGSLEFTFPGEFDEQEALQIFLDDCKEQDEDVSEYFIIS